MPTIAKIVPGFKPRHDKKTESIVKSEAPRQARPIFATGGFHKIKFHPLDGETKVVLLGNKSPSEYLGLHFADFP